MRDQALQHGVGGYVHRRDTESADVLKKQKGIDTLFVTPWLAKSLSGNDQIADRVVIYHHAKDEKIECSRCVVPKQGEKF